MRPRSSLIMTGLRANSPRNRPRLAGGGAGAGAAGTGAASVKADTRSQLSRYDALGGLHKDVFQIVYALGEAQHRHPAADQLLQQLADPSVVTREVNIEHDRRAQLRG